MTTVSTTEATRDSRVQQNISWLEVSVVGLLILAHLPVLATYTSRLLAYPHYEFAALLPVAVLILLIPRLRGAGTLTPGRWWVYLPAISLAMLLMVSSVVLDSPWFGAVSALVALGSVIYGVGGRRLFMRLLPAWALLWLAVRLPLSMDQHLTVWLQTKAAGLASTLLSKFGVLHVLEGSVVEVPGQSFMVEGVCSGIQSLFAITACTLFFVLWARRPWLRSLLVLFCAWGWVWVANVARVVSVTFLAGEWGWPVDKGWPHYILGSTLFAICLALIVSTDRLLLFFLPEGLFTRERAGFADDDVQRPLPDYGKTRLPNLSRTWVVCRPILALYVVFALFQWLPVWSVAQPIPVAMESLGADTLPKQWNGWEQVAFDVEQREGGSQWGEFSQIWYYQAGLKKVVVSVDYPFRGWHELSICYRGAGWAIENREVVPYAGNVMTFEGDRCVSLDIEKGKASRHAHVLFSIFNDRQEPLMAPEQQFNTVRKRISDFGERLRSLGAAGGRTGDDVQSFQIQLIMQGYGPIKDAEREQAHAFFSHVRGLLTPRIAGTVTEVTP